MFLAVGDQKALVCLATSSMAQSWYFPHTASSVSWPYGPLIPASHVTLDDKNDA